MSNNPTPQPGVLRYKWMDAKYHSSRDGAPISSIILHATEGHCSGDIPTLVGGDGRSVSVHWYVTKTGEIYHFVQNSDTANHAGAVKAAKYDNRHSLGIEQEHIDNAEPWPALQIKAVAQLCAFLQQQYGPIEIAYHKDVAIPPGRKSDPQQFPRDFFDTLLAEAKKLHWSAVAL